ncbi:MAG TPA: ISAs1 family transposase [Chthoniobacterales bacterium]
MSHHLSIISDPRVDRTKAHSLHDILMIAIAAMLCGAESFVDFEDFAKAKEFWLRGFLALPKGIPSHDTFGRVFAAMDNKEFAESFSNWTQSLRKHLHQEIVAIDGKTLRRSHDRSRSKSAIHMVSAWARENGLVLGQIKVDEKSNEITAIPQLLRALELKGAIVTLDAMGTQKQIAREIIEADADFVLALKGNHERVHEEVSAFLRDAREKNFQKTTHDFFESVEKDHGRIESRRYWISEDIGWFEDRGLWEGLRSVGMVESVREIQGVSTCEVRFYLSSLPAEAKTFARAVRGHWAIENSLHWSLDVCFGEDNSRVRAGYAAENMAILRHFTLNLLKRDTSKKRGINGKQKNASWDHSYLLSLLGF